MLSYFDYRQYVSIVFLLGLWGNCTRNTRRNYEVFGRNGTNYNREIGLKTSYKLV